MRRMCLPHVMWIVSNLNLRCILFSLVHPRTSRVRRPWKLSRTKYILDSGFLFHMIWGSCLKRSGKAVNQTKRIITTLLTISFITLLTTAYAAPLTVDVFTLTNGAIQKSFSMDSLPKETIINIYDLDQVELLNNALNKKITRIYQIEGQGAAVNAAKKQIMTNKITYKHIAEGFNKALLFHIKKIPAIVFNGGYKVLGTTNLDEAYEIYKSNQRGRK